MSAHQRYLPEAISEATEYPIGVSFDVQFTAFSARLEILPHDQLRIDVLDGLFARTEVVLVETILIRPGVFLVSWVEDSGATVVHLQDFAQGCLYAHLTLRDGTLVRLASAITFVCPPVPA